MRLAKSKFYLHVVPSEFRHKLEMNFNIISNIEKDIKSIDQWLSEKIKRLEKAEEGNKNILSLFMGPIFNNFLEKNEENSREQFNISSIFENVKGTFSKTMNYIFSDQFIIDFNQTSSRITNIPSDYVLDFLVKNEETIQTKLPVVGEMIIDYKIHQDPVKYFGKMLS